MKRVSLVAALLVASAASAGTPAARAQGLCDAPARVDIAPRVLRMEVGGTARLAALAYDARGLPCALQGHEWLSSNRNVVSVDGDGVVSTVGAGIAIVTVGVRGTGYTTRAVATVFVGASFPMGPGLPKGLVLSRPDRRPGPASRLAPPTASGPAMPMPRYRYANERDAYMRQFVLRLDSLLTALHDVFRNTPGTPMIGVSGPGALSSRERGRWAWCAELGGALESYAAALREGRTQSVRGSGRSLEGIEPLEAALGQHTALDQCRTIARLIDEPVENWGARYSAAAAAFYGGWYGEVRALHDANRALGRSLAVTTIPELPATPPHEFNVQRFLEARSGWRSRPHRQGLQIDRSVLAAAEAGAAQGFLLLPGITVTGALEAGDRVLADSSVVDLYALDLRAGQPIIVELRSRAFDAYLQVLSSEAAVLAEDDDFLGQGDSRVALLAPRDGRYWIVAASFSAKASRGPYTLTVR